jgi:hypothetical protein
VAVGVHGKILNWTKMDFSAAKNSPTSSDPEDVWEGLQVW